MSEPQNWHYTRTNKNPADIGTRSVPAQTLAESEWLKGPSNLKDLFVSCEEVSSTYDLVNPEMDEEIRPTVTVLKLNITSTDFPIDRFERFSQWTRLVKAVELLNLLAGSYKRPEKVLVPDLTKARTVQTYEEAEQFIIRQVQYQHYKEEIKCLVQSQPLPRDSNIKSLSPCLDEERMLRVGGRLKEAAINFKERHPLIIPKHHIAKLIITHIHENIVKHQGRHLTEGAVRSNGYWILGGKRQISSIIHKCVRCRKLRGRLQYQKMADLPVDRLKLGAPFSSVGIDVFGPWTITVRKTRGGHANSKRWAVLFTCLTSRAVHIEVIEEMSSSSFINALRRFIAIRGKVQILRSDRGTNFIGATDDLEIDAINVEDEKVKSFLYDKGVSWIFNPPHSSHMGGVWERAIGTARRILDSMLCDTSIKSLTHEVLSTLMAEVTAVMNSRPITAVSTDPEHPEILSPSLLLTHKLDCVTAPTGEFSIKDMYRAQWKMVQHLANIFWNKWRMEYLSNLQKRQKWQDSVRDIQKDDIVLLKDKDVNRCQWPMGIVKNAIKSKDAKIRKVEVKVTKDGKISTYTRPVTDLVLLLNANNE